MLTLLADAPSTCTSAWWNSFLGPIGVVVGAFITGLVTWRNARKSVYERLDILVQIRKEWPDNISGYDTLEHSIAIALAEIRRKEPGHVPAPTSESERKADAEVKLSERYVWFTRAVFPLIVGVIGVISVIIFAPPGTNTGHASQADLLPTIITAITALAAMVIAIAIPRR
ncbi:hypothetical protein [Mycobacterium paraffinicum]|uniref:hypothetical protein n=1 Tax=Mycobacterium paraffinicum TaxID=53378 RepID=UPI001114F88D|nr:hypothetical protein [Mycobacterium paraffinicum]